MIDRSEAPPTPALARPALWIAAAYLALTLPLLLGGAGPVPVRATLIHVALLAIVLALLATRRQSRRPLLGVASDWLPLLLMAGLYAELPYLITALARPLQDPLVLGWEQWVFGAEPARTFAIEFPNPTLANALHLAYLLYYPLIFVPPAILYFAGRRPEFARTITALTATFAACFVAYIVFPVEGPRYLWPPAAAPADEPIRALALHILASGSSRGAAFPSSHMAVSLVEALAALRFQPRVGAVVFVLSAGIGVGAVYGGFHYGVDIIAGAALGLTVWFAVDRVAARAYGQASELSASRASAS